ncbi:MAG: pantoate--beta-alanine ligase [Candidatus Omnitrophica bacterium]|nr:pantoate--beta-alanine ligase [Candidatus Omnitrophota bacterium]
MLVIRSAARMAALARRLARQGKRIGFVPTMGALHEGHRSLIRAAAARHDVVIVSIFVNPLQFGPREDFARYPRPFRRDLRVARAAGADIIFAPSARELYPGGFQTAVEVGPLARRWEGRVRPGHFRGVATVVAILFELTRPTSAYVGQKDYQQALIIRRLIRDLRLPIRLRILPTVREARGLAMSSRNASLSAIERRRAAALYRALRAGRDRIRAGERRADHVVALMRRLIRAPRLVRLDYVAVVDGSTLEPLRRLRGRVALVGAVRVGRTRLIDNILVDVP